MEDYIIVYYYSKKEKSWIVEARNSEDFVVETVKTHHEELAREQAKTLTKKYDAIRYTKIGIK